MHPFVEDRAAFEALGARTIAMLGEYLRALPAQPVDRVVPEEVRRRLMSLPLPEQGQAAEDILEFLRREILPWPIAIGHKRSYGWVNSPPAPIAILADAVGVAMNSGLDGYDHGALFLMSSLGRWIMDLVGFPQEGSLCLLLSGGSMATLNALTAARYRAAAAAGWNLRAEGLQGGRARLVLYSSEEGHSSVQKCAEQLGIGTDNLRRVPVDAEFRMRPEALGRAIEQDLLVDGLVRRYLTDSPEVAIDGLPPGEGVFLPCSFWLAELYARMGRTDEGLRLFERLVSLRNDVGLLAEEYDPGTRRHLGNFPQAFTHLALVNAAYAFAGIPERH